MATIILVVLFSILANIFAYNPECENKSYCECLMQNETTDAQFFHISHEGVSFGIKVRSWSRLQIDCHNKGWNTLYLTGKKFGRRVDLVEFYNCILPERTTLKNIVKSLGINEINGLSIQSFRNLSTTLKNYHIEEFSNVTKLILSNNGLTRISSRLLKDFSRLESLDLSENPLVISKHTFRGTSNLKELYLDESKITEIDSDLFHYIKDLEILSLERNLLKEFHVGTFDKLTSLKYLNLRSNVLSYLPELIFSGLKNLETIDLSNNYFNSLPILLFIGNTKLQKVLLNDNKRELKILPDEFFMDLQNLEEVQLKKNALRSLPENIFWGSTSLKYIDCSVNFIKILPEHIFKNLQNVQYLVLSYNSIKELPDLVFRYIKNLKVLDLSFNRISNIQRNLFQDLTSLLEINMEGNHLKYIDKSAFSSNEQLSIAKFSNNMLQFDSSNETLSPFYNNRLLTELHLANNRIKHFFRDWAANKVELELLDLSYNNISTITTDDFVFWKHIVIVNLRNNNIKKIFLNNIESSAKRNYGNRHFVIDVKNNPLSCDCSLYDIVRYFNGDMPVTVYNFIELILGNLTCVQPDGTQGPLINQLDFKTYKCQEDAFFELHKNCQTRCTCYVRPYDKARILDCSYKNIPIFRIDKSKVHFVSMHALVLNFTGNHLKRIPSLDDLQEFNLIELFLSNNQISKVSLDNFPTTLKILELHNNNIARLDYNVSNFLFRQDFQLFTLSGNPFICDCDNRFLYRLVLGKQHIHKDLKNVKCKDRNIPLLNMTHEQLCPSMVRH